MFSESFVRIQKHFLNRKSNRWRCRQICHGSKQ